MRIRKRQVPLPLSDPNLIDRSPVMVQLTDATTTSPKQSCTHSSISLLDPPQPSDHHSLPPIHKPTNGSDDSQGRKHQKKQDNCLVEDEGGEGEKGNDTRKGNILGAEMSTEQDGRWCEGEKAFPPKKRRGSFENSNINNDDSKKKMKMKTKTKTNKYDSNEEEEEEVIRETKSEVKVGNNKKKKKVRGGAVMEGSRCSRVNGRGWRCCQPTLVGYSLCEHHLGKGRLRSMTSVRNRSIATTTTAPKNSNNNMTLLSESTSSSLSTLEKNIISEEVNGDEKKKPPIITSTKKRMKLGMVKARSISSLLGQTNTTHEVANLP